MRRTIGALVAGFGASLVILLVEVARLNRAEVQDAVVDFALVRTIIVDLAPDHLLLALFAAAFVLALSSARSLLGETSKITLLLPAAASMPVFVWVAFELARGSGVVRAGLGAVVIMAVPLIAGGATALLAFIVSWTRRLGPWPAALLLAAVIVAVGIVNRTWHVGRYQPVHETLQLFELFAVAAVVHVLIHRRSEVRPTLKALAGLLIGLGLALQGLALWPMGEPPPEELRSLYGRHGFHSAALLRWRARLDPLEIDDGGIDETLVERIEAWNRKARAFEARLDELVPDRRSFNLLLVSIDTLRPDRLGSFGARRTRTPEIDEFAASSAVFENAYAQYPSTALSTESLFHGRYPRATGIYRKNKGELSPEDLRVHRLSEIALANGMRTAAAIAFTAEWMQSPLFSRSLESFELINPDRAGAPRLDGEYFADSAMAAMTKLQSERFFLWFHLFDPHHPYEFRPGYATSEDALGRYDGEVRYADEQLGRVFDFMKLKGLWDNTVIILTSDHGEAFGEKGLRYHGSSLQEAQIKVPLIVRVPGLPAVRVPEIVENVDLYQTIATLLALDGASANQGSDLSPLIVAHDEFAADFPSFAYAELPDDIQELSVASTRTASYREGRWKLIRQLSLDYSELYDVVSDPTELRDLARQETAQRLRLERRLRTMQRLTDQFGRSLSSDEIRRRKIETGRSRLREDDPYKVFAGLSFVEENDLFELRGLVANIALDDGQFPELRSRALRQIADWGVEGWRGQAIDWLGDPNPVFRWVAAGLLIDDGLVAAAGVSGLSPDQAASILETVKTRQERPPLPVMQAAMRLVMARVAATPAPVGALEIVRAALDDPLTDVDLRRVLVRASAHLLEDPLVHSDLFTETDERHGLLEVLWSSGRRDLWLEYARRLLPDRYLPASIKERLLDLVLSEFPDEVIEEFGVPLLARWDPSFHEAVTRRLSEKLGAPRVRVLQRCHGRIADGRDLLASGNHAAAVDAFAAASALAPGTQAVLATDLDRLRSLIALDRWADAEALRGGLLARAETSGSASMIRRARALDGYLSRQGGLESESGLRVLEAEPAREDRRFVATGGALHLDVVLANEHDRPLLGGPWKHGGRLRVLWSRPGKEEIDYGSEYTLDRDLLPGETRRIRMPVIAPAEPGAWQGRVIVNEHEGNRFHVVEDEEAEFAVSVIRPHLGAPGGRWNPVEILKDFSFDPSLEGFMAGPDDGSLLLVAESYEGAFRSPPVGFSGGSRRLSLRGRWYSGIDQANLVRVELVPLPGFDPVPPSFAELAWDGRDFDLALDLPAAVGLYQVEVRIGYRQGVLALDSVELR